MGLVHQLCADAEVEAATQELALEIASETIPSLAEVSKAILNRLRTTVTSDLRQQFQELFDKSLENPYLDRAKVRFGARQPQGRDEND